VLLQLLRTPSFFHNGNWERASEELGEFDLVHGLWFVVCGSWLVAHGPSFLPSLIVALTPGSLHDPLFV
jgi:hypothetical protein